ncbi:MAG: Spy/CpxP family protein refolding chaperone [Pyrinomonadaceae bacterium]
MMKTKKIVGALVLAAGLVTTGAIGFAQQQGAAQEKNGEQRGERQWKRDGEGKGRHGMHDGFGPFARGLNLTDAQKEQMKQIAARYHESNKAMREQMRAQRGGEAGAFDGTFNESAVRAAAQARANAQVEMEVSHARMMSEMYAVLTPEQKAQLAQQREQWKQKMNERRERRNSENPAQKQ